MFVVEIMNLDNAAFEDDASAEIARILRIVADRVDDAMVNGVSVSDTNGNRVCHAWLSPRYRRSGV